MKMLEELITKIQHWYIFTRLDIKHRQIDRLKKKINKIEDKYRNRIIKKLRAKGNQ